MRRKGISLVLLMAIGGIPLVAAPAPERSPCVTGQARLGDFALEIPPGFCEYHRIGPDFDTGEVVRNGSEETLLHFYAGSAGPTLESLARQRPDQVCDGAIVEKPTEMLFDYGGQIGHLVLRSRSQTSKSGTCRQATWYVRLDNGSRSPSLLIFEYYGASPALRDAANSIIDHPIVTAH